jgi:FG-GAP-like repeat/ASPIC and UnbV
MRKLPTSVPSHRKWILAAALLLLDAAVSSATAQIAFEDVSVAAGLGNTASETWGISWGDLDGDHYPDFFCNNHRTRASLHRNNQNGTFTDVSKQVDLSKTPGWTGGRADVDTHGAAWADIDNDGDQDLFESVSSSADHLWINDNGRLTLSTVAYGVDQLSRRSTRQTLFVDYNGDGRLDLASISLTRPTFSPQLANGTFGHGPGVDSPMSCTTDGQWGHLVDADGSGGLEVMCAPRNGLYPKVNSIADGVITDVGGQYPQFNTVNDAVTLDYDGDLRPDLFLVRGPERPSDAYQYSSQGFEAQMITASNRSKSVTFRTTGLITISASLRAGSNPQGDPKNINIGSSRWSPTSLVITLDSTDHNNWGIATGSLGINIGYLPDTGQWKISQGAPGYNYTYLQVTSTAPITGLTFLGASPADLGTTPLLVTNTANGLVTNDTAGFTERLRCESAAAGDFDNDMHEDIFLACTGGSHNIANRLYRNNGDGTFTEVPNAGGAAGLIGAAVADHAGTSDSVAVADYDLDGFLDLLVTNGLNMRPVYIGGPKQLFHNLGNGNKWIEFDLVGTTSNRDGVGSKLYVSAGGVTQYREQNGGFHRWSQNFMRVHVGLAANTQADTTVLWPDGTSTTYAGLVANHIYQLKQDGQYAQIH